MALQDLTPQLRTRLSRMERAAGWFVLLAALLMVAGLAYYLKVMAERKGWGIQKINYQTSLFTAAGLKVGDPVKLIGRDVGEITRIELNDPHDYFGITVFFWIKKPYFGYVMSDSTVKVNADFLGNRGLEVSKGAQGLPTVLANTNQVALKMLKRDYFERQFTAFMKQTNDAPHVLYALNVLAKEKANDFYGELGDNSSYWLYPAESPAINERLEKLVNQVEAALPGITNQIATVLGSANRMSTNASDLMTTLLPVATNLAVITGNIRDPNGSLGEWLLSTNFNSVIGGLDSAIDDLGNITSNLNVQVRANSNMLSGISKTVMDTDELVQGLKRHWLLRSAFKTKKTNAPPSTSP